MEKAERRGVGRRVRELRKALGITQTELADRIHVRQATVSDYENGKLQLDADELPTVATALGVRVADLFDEPAAGTLLTMTREDLLTLVTDLAQRMSAHDSHADPASDSQPSATHLDEIGPDGTSNFCAQVATPRLRIPVLTA